MSLFLVAATSIHSVKQSRMIIGSVMVTLVLVVIYGFGQIYLHFPVISTTNSEFSKGLILFLSNDARVNSTFAGHYDLAIYLSMTLMFAASFFFYYKKLFHKAFITLLGLSSFALLGFTAARMSFVATLLGLAMFLWIKGKKLLMVGLFVAALGLVAAVPELRHRLVATLTVNVLNGGGPKYTPAPNEITVFTPANQLPPGMTPEMRQKAIDESTKSASASGRPVDIAPGEPVNTTELGVYRSFGIRFNVEWPRALRAFYKNPFLGTGYSSISIASDNDYLRSLGETGLLGTLTLALIFMIILKRMWAYIKSTAGGFSKPFIFGSYCAVIVVLITATFIDALEASKVAEVFWLILGVSWAMMSAYDVQPKEDEK